MSRQKLKRALKNVRWIYWLNAAMKARGVWRAYERNVVRYKCKPLAGTAELLLLQRSGATLHRFQSLQRPLRIFYMGTDELQDRSGIVQALESLGDLTYFEQPNGTYGQFLKGSRAERQEINTRQLLASFERLHSSNKTPDILFGQLQNHYLHGSALDEIRERYGTLVANINMDDRHQYFGAKQNGEWSGTYPLIRHVDIVLTAAPECVDWYLKEGCPALFFPEASDSAIFHPMRDLPKLHDVSFIGARYGIRDGIVSSLCKAGVKVTAYGSGWEAGRLSNEDVPRLFAQSKIILGVGTIGYSTNFYTLKMRDFDATMSGSCYLTHPNPDLSLLFDVGKEILTYSSCDDCVAKVRYYLEHDKEREAIAAAGRTRAEREHTWTRRFSEVLEFLRCSGVQEQVIVGESANDPN